MKHSVLFYHSPEYTVAFGVLVQAWSQLNIANTCQFTPWIQLKKNPKQTTTHPPPSKKKKNKPLTKTNKTQTKPHKWKKTPKKTNPNTWAWEVPFLPALRRAAFQNWSTADKYKHGMKNRTWKKGCEETRLWQENLLLSCLVVKGNRAINYCKAKLQKQIIASTQSFSAKHPI